MVVPDDEEPPVRDPLAEEIAAYRSAQALLEQRTYSAASAAFDALIDAHPKGRLRREAMIGLVEAHIGLQAYDEAAVLTTVLLADPMLPDRLRREVLYWGAESLRRQGDCSRALTDFRAVASAETSPRADDASWMRVWCLVKLNQAQRARKEAQGYIRRFPKGRFIDSAREALAP